MGERVSIEVDREDVLAVCEFVFLHAPPEHVGRGAEWVAVADRLKAALPQPEWEPSDEQMAHFMRVMYPNPQQRASSISIEWASDALKALHRAGFNLTLRTETDG